MRFPATWCYKNTLPGFRANLTICYPDPWCSKGIARAQGKRITANIVKYCCQRISNHALSNVAIASYQLNSQDAVAVDRPVPHHFLTFGQVNSEHFLTNRVMIDRNPFPLPTGIQKTIHHPHNHTSTHIHTHSYSHRPLLHIYTYIHTRASTYAPRASTDNADTCDVHTHA